MFSVKPQYLKDKLSEKSKKIMVTIVFNTPRNYTILKQKKTFRDTGTYYADRR